MLFFRLIKPSVALPATVKLQHIYHDSSHCSIKRQFVIMWVELTIVTNRPTKFSPSVGHSPVRAYYWRKDHHICLLDSMRWFSHRRSPSPRAARNGIVCCCLLRAAYGLATAHALLRIVNGDDSAAVFLSLATLTFDVWPWPSNSGEVFVHT